MLAWLALVLVHTPPALAIFSSRLRQRMYGVEETPQLGVILVHRGVLFLSVAAVCLYAAFTPEARRAATLAGAISVLGFLIAFAAAKAPKGPLRAIALADTMALAPLALVVIDAW